VWLAQTLEGVEQCVWDVVVLAAIPATVALGVKCGAHRQVFIRPPLMRANRGGSSVHRDRSPVRDTAQPYSRTQPQRTLLQLVHQALRHAAQCMVRRRLRAASIENRMQYRTHHIGAGWVGWESWLAGMWQDFARTPSLRYVP
jgi:hypothetical protein